MLSIAVLGLLALAVVPDSHATDAQVVATEEAASQLPVEISVVREVDEINAGRFNPARSGDADDAIVIASPVRTTTISRRDPNL
jgi:hypothetical protein